MDGRLRALFKRGGILTIVLYVITVPVYILCFYKPHDLLPEKLYNGEKDQWAIELNEMYKSWNHDEIVHFCLTAFLCCLIVSMLILTVYNEIEFYIKPVITVEARLKSKDTNVSMAGNTRGVSVPRLEYYLTFETVDSVEMIFEVGPEHYMTLFEGNRGILKYKKGMIERFTGFDITAIE